MPQRSSKEFSRKGPDAWTMDERFPTNSGDEELQKRKKGATRLNSWRVSFRSEVTSGSCHP